MKITMITPAPPGSRAGNRATAERWARLLNTAGHEVNVVTDYAGEPCDVFIALHAWRSHDAIQTFRKCWPETPLILALTGTDIYRHQKQYPLPTRASMAAADLLIGLHALVAEDIPEEFTSKLTILYQSADAVPRHTPGAEQKSFDVCVVGHLRDEKDSLRAAKAARLLPQESTIRVLCAGKPHNATWQSMVEQESAENPRLKWLGELDKRETQELLAKCQLMVISSVMEGGANVVSEASRAGLPVLASDIPGNRGLLGDDYEGYFPVEDQAALAEKLVRAETDPDYLERLRAHVVELGEKFTPENEQRSLELALDLASQRRAAYKG